MQKLRKRSIGIDKIRFSRSESGFIGVTFERALYIAVVEKARLNLYEKPVGRRFAAWHLGAALSHRPNCRHPRIGTSAVA